jgi:hypothetical protein
MKGEETNFDELDLDKNQIKWLIRKRRKEIKAIFRKYMCTEHKQYARLNSLERVSGAYNIDIGTCCEKHRDLLQSKI